jgi:hypothetical protein
MHLSFLTQLKIEIEHFFLPCKVDTKLIFCTSQNFVVQNLSRQISLFIGDVSDSQLFGLSFEIK